MTRFLTNSIIGGGGLTLSCWENKLARFAGSIHSLGSYNLLARGEKRKHDFTSPSENRNIFVTFQKLK